MTLIIQLGNSDDKLTQKQWNKFVASINFVIYQHITKIHFFGAPSSFSEYQNVCWVVECKADKIESLKSEIKVIREKFKQDSVAFTIGETQFI